jgi:Raf kinase inhibitor-like YbhB/YbcL family protein
MSRRALAAVLAGGMLLAGCSSSGSHEVEAPMTISVTSPAFSDGDTIPQQYTCDGDDVSPPLAVRNVPSGAVELALLVEDPDAPGGTFVHWVAWGIDPGQADIAAGAPTPGSGKNGFGRTGYRGPCPPPGKPHRYVFTVYALSERLDLDAGASADALRQAIDGKALATGSLTGRYGR